MRLWLRLLAGPIIWAAHFFVVYAIGEFAGDGMAERLWIGAVTVMAVVALASLLFANLKSRARDWSATSSRVLMALSLIAVLWQSLPALLIV